MTLTDEQAKKLAEEINALAPKSAEVVCRDSVVDGKVVEVAEVKVRIEDRRTGNSVRWSSALVEGEVSSAKKIVASLKKQLAEAARRTRAAIAAERED